jgi:hypothetical protein
MEYSPYTADPTPTACLIIRLERKKAFSEDAVLGYSLISKTPGQDCRL